MRTTITRRGRGIFRATCRPDNGREPIVFEGKKADVLAKARQQARLYREPHEIVDNSPVRPTEPFRLSLQPEEC